MQGTLTAISWHIAGQGSIGALATANILRHGISVYPIRRELRTTNNNQFRTLDNDVIELPQGQLISQCDVIDNLFVPLKAYDVLPFLELCVDKLSPNANVVLCHNGMGTIEPALNLLPQSINLYFCTTNNGAYKKDTQIIHAGCGDSFWKLIRQGHEKTLTSSDFNVLFEPCVESTDLQQVLWKKLLINCAINPLTAIYKVKNGALAQQQYKETIEQVIKEICLVANSDGISLCPNEMSELVYQVIDKTANNTSSMLQDVSNSKKTEIDYINGFVVKLAKKLGKNVPVNHELYSKVNAI